jgi:hypothetical protein
MKTEKFDFDDIKVFTMHEHNRWITDGSYHYDKTSLDELLTAIKSLKLDKEIVVYMIGHDSIFPDVVVIKGLNNQDVALLRVYFKNDDRFNENKKSFYEVTEIEDASRMYYLEKSLIMNEDNQLLVTYKIKIVISPDYD